MRRAAFAAALAALAAAALSLAGSCTSGGTGTATATPSPAASPAETPSDQALMILHDECTGLASIPDCKNAAIACAKAVEVYTLRQVPADDKWYAAVLKARDSCSPK